MKSVTANVAGFSVVKNATRLFREIVIDLFCTRYHLDVFSARIEKIQSNRQFFN
jgi:hypothetical protein